MAEIEFEPTDGDKVTVDVILALGLTSSLLDPLDAWRRSHPIEITRQQAIRLFLEEALQMRGYISEPEDSALQEWDAEGEPN